IILDSDVKRSILKNRDSILRFLFEQLELFEEHFRLYMIKIFENPTLSYEYFSMEKIRNITGNPLEYLLDKALILNFNYTTIKIQGIKSNNIHGKLYDK